MIVQILLRLYLILHCFWSRRK